MAARIKMAPDQEPPPQVFSVSRLEGARFGRAKSAPRVPPARDSRAWPDHWPTAWEVDELAEELGVPSPLDDPGAAAALDKAANAPALRQDRFGWWEAGGEPCEAGPR